MMAGSENNKGFYGADIPSDWEVVNLDEITEKIGDGLHGTPEYVNSSEYFFINGNNLKEGIIQINNDTKCISEEEYKKHKKDLKYKSILLSINGTIGSLAYYRNEKIILGKSAAYINCKDENTDYLYYYLQSESVICFFEGELTGSTIRNLSLKSIRETPIPLPPLPEQRAIAHILGLMDRAIHLNNQLIAPKELRKKWLMQQLLTGKKRLKGFEGEWREVKLGKLFNQIKNVNDGGNSHSIMTISSKLGLISQEDKFDRVIAGESLKKYTQLKLEDFAYNKGNSKTYPMGCIYQLEEKESALVPFVYICFSPTKLVDAKFYKHWFLAHGLDRQLNKIITSGARGDGLLNVNTDDFFNLKIIYPPKEEQTAIAQILDASGKEIQLLKAKTEKLREQKKGMMQVLLTGKKRLNQDLQDLLMNRIQEAGFV